MSPAHKSSVRSLLRDGGDAEWEDLVSSMGPRTLDFCDDDVNLNFCDEDECQKGNSLVEGFGGKVVGID